MPADTNFLKFKILLNGRNYVRAIWCKKNLKTVSYNFGDYRSYSCRSRCIKPVCCDQAEQAVITRFGRYYKTLGPGLHHKLPLGIDRKFIVPGNKVVQTEQFGFKTVKSGSSNQYENNIVKESTMLTGDLNIVGVEWIIQY